MAFPWGAALAAGGSVLGAGSQHKARRRQEHLRAEHMAKFGKAFQSVTGLFQDELATLQELYDNYGALYGRAQGAVSQINQDAYRRVLEGQQQRMGSMQAGLASRGLYNSTIGANLSRGIQTDTGRALGEIDSRTAALRAGLFTGQAAGQGQALLARAGAQENMGRMRYQRALDRVNLWLGGGQTFNTDIYGQLGSAGAYIDDYLQNRNRTQPSRTSGPGYTHWEPYEG